MSVLNDRGLISTYLQRFKKEGQISFDLVLAIPSDQRIPVLINEWGMKFMTSKISGILGMAMNSLNLRVGMTEDQLLDIAIDILEEAKDDNLAMEDVLLFLQQLVRGKRGKIYDRMDSPTFFEMFETYREERHQAMMRIREEQAANHQALGDTQRTSHDLDKDMHRAALGEYIKMQYGTEQRTNQQDCTPGT